MNRLVARNMHIRRHLLLEHPLDEHLIYGCCDERICVRLRALVAVRGLCGPLRAGLAYPLTSVIVTSELSGAGVAQKVFSHTAAHSDSTSGIDVRIARFAPRDRS